VQGTLLAGMPLLQLQKHSLFWESQQMPSKNCFLAFLILIVSCAILGSCTSRSDRQLRTLLQKGVEHGYPGIAMLIQEGNGKIHSSAVGYSVLEHHTPLRVDDAFHMASINKTFTAVAILRLIDEGKLSLNDTLKDRLGNAASRIPYADRITISQLLDHSSGIYPTNNDMDYLTTIIGPKADPARVWKPEELVALADKDRSRPAGLPGEGHFYSDTNYILLGMIVERTTGQSYKEYVRKTVIEPLGMQSTYFYSDYMGKNAHPPVVPVQGYLLSTKDLRGVIEPNAMFRPVPGDYGIDVQLLNTTLAAERTDAAGGLVTTLPELLKFASALFRGKLLSPQSHKFMMSVVEGMEVQPLEKKRIWALQAIHKPYGVLVYKEGDGPGGVNTLMAYRPATDEIFIGFTNSFGYFNEVDFMMDDVIGKFVLKN
jgi:D-alanyl-D-alanine carboxypeptidase